MVVAAATVATGEVVVEALVPMLVPVVGLVQVAVLLLAAAGAVLQLLLLLLAVGAALLLLLLVAVGAAVLLLLAMGAAVLLLLVADGRGAALHLTESIETKCKDLVVNITNCSTYS